MLAADLLDLLRCPACKGRLVADAEHRSLTCRHCQVRYPVRDDIPILLMEAGTPV
jgi:uncharacterized protein